MATILFTGFPGFLGSELLPRVLARSEEDRVVCLVQPRWADLARRRADALVASTPALEGRIRLAEGDVGRPGLGLEDPGALAAELSEVFHLAAVYDLSVPREVGMRVNVDGTRNVLDLAGRAQRLKRFHYVSTCYVSGRHAGPFAEEDLEKGQRFANYYEETKFLAEVEVRARMRQGLEATIYRPSVVVGDSRTGATQKYDGPYFFLRWLAWQPRVAVMPAIGDPTATRLNVVPRDFVVDAIAFLSGREASAGRCYQLADPEPPTIAELTDLFATALGKRVVWVPITQGLLKAVLRGFRPLMALPPESADYLCHPSFYLTTNAQADLAGSGLEVPPLRAYLDTLLAFRKAHPEVSSAAMV